MPLEEEEGPTERSHGRLQHIKVDRAAALLVEEGKHALVFGDLLLAEELLRRARNEERNRERERDTVSIARLILELTTHPRAIP